VRNYLKSLETSQILRKDSEGKFHIKMTDSIYSGQYKEMIVGELDRNYSQIRDMYDKLTREEKEDQTL